MEAHSVYLHIPFCRHRCAYCDFNTYAGQEQALPAYVDALNHEIRQASASRLDGLAKQIPIHSVFFGGGTPSLLSTVQAGSILSTISDSFDLLADAEITLEANPGTVTEDFLGGLRRVGVNRLSLGMQSARDVELHLIERQHNFTDVVQAVSWARRAGFDNLSLDLLFAIPGQSMEDWMESLERALELETEHLSLYSLTIEEGTPFHRWMTEGRFKPVEEDLAADMMEYAEERLQTAGFNHYEISNWARHTADFRFECRHNLQYWRNRPYFGFGAGAHACLEGFRMANARGIWDYIRLVESAAGGPPPLGPAAVETVTIDKMTAMQESMMVGLRLTREGVGREAFYTRYRRDLRDVFASQIEKLTSQGLLEWANGGATLRLTGRGRFVGNRVFLEFVGEG